MGSAGDSDGEFIEQALLGLDGLLEDEALAALRDRLADGVESRRLFVQLCMQSQALAEVLGLPKEGVLPADQAGLEAAVLRAVEAWGDVEPTRAIGRSSRRRGPSRRARRTWLPWSVAAAACIGLLLNNGPIAWRQPVVEPARPQQVGVPGQERQPAPGGVRRALAPLDALAMMIKLDGALWEPEDGPPPAERDLLSARRLRLRSGRSTLAFLSGVTLTLEGPADLDLVSIDRVYCRQGRLRARVPKGAEGFVVASPGSAVIDLGTEFALNVEADGRSRVMVFEGAAEAALLNPAGSAERTQLVERSKAFELDPRTHRITEARAQPDGFVPAPSLSVPSLVLDPAYAGAILKSRPRGYWRFESLSAGSIPNEVPGSPPLAANGPVGIAVGPLGNGYAAFKPGSPEQYLTTEALWPISREPGHAVEFWFLSEGISHASLVGMFPPKDYLSLGHRGRFVHTFLVELTARDRQSLFKPASVRFLHRWPLDTRIGNNVFTDDVYIPRRWHHVLAQKTGDRMELFFDGALDHSMPLGPDHPALSCRLVIGRRATDPLELEDVRPFVGRLDELAIYDHPLSADEVRRHFQLATSKD
jgi:hypothetical protein